MGSLFYVFTTQKWMNIEVWGNPFFLLTAYKKKFLKNLIFFF